MSKYRISGPGWPVGSVLIPPGTIITPTIQATGGRQRSRGVDLDGLLPKEISGEGARALQGGAKAAAGVAGALFRRDAHCA